MKFFSAVVAAIALATSVSAGFTSSGSSMDGFQLSTVTHSPDPPKVGQNLCITVTGTLSNPITQGAQLHVSATFWGFNVYDNTSDLCADLAGGANPCPIATSVNSVTNCISVPSNVFPGISINLQATVTNAGGERLFQIGGPLTFSH